MPETIFMNRERAEQWQPQPGWVAISIWTPEVKGITLVGARHFPAQLKPGFDDVLFLSFPDDDTELVSSQVQAIWHFFQQHSAKNFLIHCDAGLSRSAAVASVLCVWRGGIPFGFECGSARFANSAVRRSLMRELHTGERS